MITRIAQRTRDDCAICTVAMIMGPPYTYERVLQDSRKYPMITRDGKYPAWWETYLREEAFDIGYRGLDGLSDISVNGGALLGILGMTVPHMRAIHIVAVDEIGVVDPADKAPDHVPFQQYVLNRVRDGAVFHDEWLAVRKVP